MDLFNSPEHVAIILDGNRRFAKRLKLEPWKGHEYGEKRVEELIEYSKDLGIKELTLYVLSIENIENRPKKELDFLYRLFEKAFDNLDKEKLAKNNIKIKFIGNLDLIPENLKKICRKLEKETEKNSGFILNFAIAYGGRQEIVRAVKKIIENKIKPNKVSENLIKENLYLKSEPDLIIRTGREKRISNFLPWQSIYSELIFIDKMWPEFEKDDMIICIEEFKKRKRSFGK